MALLDFFLSRKKNTANIAKERLQIIVAERRHRSRPHHKERKLYYGKQREEESLPY